MKKQAPLKQKTQLKNSQGEYKNPVFKPKTGLKKQIETEKTEE